VGRTLLVSGPADIQLVQGKVGIYAYPLERNRVISIPEGKQLPVEVLENSTLECWISAHGKYSEIVGNTVPDSWMETAETMLENRKGRIMILGNVDAGKSTFCTVLANLALKAGMKITVLDLDLGQSDIGPPGSIGLGRVRNHILTLSEVTPEVLYFVGYISPAPVTDKILEGVNRLLPKTESDVLVVNTDGWILGEQAIIFKSRLINTFEPSFVVGIGRETDLRPILEMTGCTSFQVDSPSLILKRTREQRKELRELAYRKYLKDGRVITIDTHRIQLVDSYERMIQHAEFDSSLINSLLGFIDDQGWLVGIGVLLRINRRNLEVLSPVINRFHRVEIGAVKLDEHGSELSYLE
jgi:polynucleotide 5'-hydroxyl-kinase GRC3/NOL9